MNYDQNTNCGLKAKLDIDSIYISVLKWQTRIVFSKYYKTFTMIGYITPISRANILFKMEENTEREERGNVFLDLEKIRVSSLLSLSLSLPLSLLNYLSFSLYLFLSHNFQHKL